MIKKIGLFLCGMLLLTGCATTPKNEKVIPSVEPENVSWLQKCTVLFDIKPGSDVTPIIFGTVSRYSTDPNNETGLGIFVEIKSDFRYYWKEELRTITVYNLFANMSELSTDITEGLVIRENRSLGKADKRSSSLIPGNSLVIGLRTEKPDVYMSYMTNSAPYPYDNNCWYSVVALINGSYPQPNFLEFEHIYIENFDFSKKMLGKPIRFWLNLDEYPTLPKEEPDFALLYIGTVTSGVISDYKTANYSYILSKEENGRKLIFLWPENLANEYNRLNLKGKDLYFFGYIGSSNEKATMIVVTSSADSSPEMIMSDVNSY